MNDPKAKLINYNQYKQDIFFKLNFKFNEGAKLLDLGCGDGSDSVIFRDVFKLDVNSCDVYKDTALDQSLKFKLGSALDIPYESGTFDYIFMHDVLHHVDEKSQSYELHSKVLKECSRVLKPGGTLIVIEGNRYNPLFYPHMVKMRGHDHFVQSYFKKIFIDTLPATEFRFFEAHYYPQKLLKLFKIYEWLIERFCPKDFLAYNVAIWHKPL